MINKTIGRTLAAAIGAALTLAGCSGGDANDADVEFAQGMIPHHAQAVDMARLAAERSDNSDVIELAAQVEAAQDPEIELMSGWLEDWGEDVPATSGTDYMGHDQGGHDAMAGMMTAEQMAGLAAASGEDFDLMFLEMMIEHHEGAIVMAEDVLARGSDDDVQRLAKEIIEVQQAEINHMQELLGGDAPRAERLGHIHGLGVSDGVLHVATHHGLFAVSEDGDAWIVSNDDHDFMGFTVVDDGTFLASGHPGGRADLPGNLGLLESTDGGVTWSTLSLMGEVDFHALDATGDAVYGYDSASGALLASADRTSWQRLGQIPLADVAVSPDDSSVVVITTEGGPQISRDGGRSFDVIAGAPLLMLVDWQQNDEIVGITPDGVVYLGADDGGSWERRGDIGSRPHALTVGSGSVYVATDHAILHSADGGRTYAVMYEMH